MCAVCPWEKTTNNEEKTQYASKLSIYGVRSFWFFVCSLFFFSFSFSSSPIDCDRNWDRVHFQNHIFNKRTNQLHKWIKSIGESVDAQSTFLSIDLSVDDDIDCLQIEINLSLRLLSPTFVYIEMVDAHSYMKNTRLRSNRNRLFICYCYQHWTFCAWYYNGIR